MNSMKHKSKHQKLETSVPATALNELEDEEDEDKHHDHPGSPSEIVVVTLKQNKMPHYLQFAIALIKVSYQNHGGKPWDAEETARLIILIKNTLNLDGPTTLEQLVIGCNFIAPQDLAALQEEGLVFTPDMLMHMLELYSVNGDLVTHFDSAINLDLFDLDDADTLEAVSFLQ
jgi:hypothetical protein